jgi:hypothetical protein
LTIGLAQASPQRIGLLGFSLARKVVIGAISVCPGTSAMSKIDVISRSVARNPISAMQPFLAP